MFLLYTFIVSFLVVVLVLLSKMREVNVGRQTFVGSILSKGDPTIITFITWAKGFFNHHWERTFFLFLVHLPSRMEAFFSSLKAKAHDHYDNASAKMRDRREFSQNTVSPYMRSMPMRGEGDAR